MPRERVFINVKKETSLAQVNNPLSVEPSYHRNVISLVPGLRARQKKEN